MIKVLDKGMFKDKLIGVFELDLAQIYLTNAQHAIHHQWVALVCPCDHHASNAIKGYFRLSIAVQGPGDSSVRLTDAAGGESFEDQEVLMPASIRKEYKQINIGIIQA